MTAAGQTAGGVLRPPLHEHEHRHEQQEERFERVYVWDIVVRLTHWLLVLGILVLAVTGVYIGSPFLAPADPAHGLLLTATVKVVHFYTAIVFSFTVLTRLLWMFVGPPYARWNQFVPASRRRLRDVFGMLRFYLFIDRRPPLNVGHNPLAGLAYLAVYALCLLMIASGLALYSVDAGASYMKSFDFLLPIFGGPQSTRYIHHVAMWFIIGFFAHHIWSAILVSRVEGAGLIDSMFSGFKFFPPRWRDRER